LQGGRDGSQDEIVWGETFAEEEQNDAMSVEQAEQALLTAVRRQLVADVEVGVFLSGGLDSTLVLSAAAGLGARPQAFSLGFAGHGDYDEAGTASRVAARLGVPHDVEQFSASLDSGVNAVGEACVGSYSGISAIARTRIVAADSRAARVAKACCSL
jgi:asparagine synthetase B (glutamine-hydrolysing)